MSGIFDKAQGGGTGPLADVFKGVEDAKVTQGGDYFDDGDYDLEVMTAKLDVARKKGTFAAVHFKVLGSNNEKHPVGSEGDWFNGSWTEGFLSNAKEFGQAVMSTMGNTMVDETDITQEVLGWIFDKGGENIRGVKVRVRVKKKPTKAGGEFSRHFWFPVMTAPAKA